MSLNFGLSSTNLLFWGGALITLGYIIKNKQAQEIGSYVAMGGAIWHFASNVLGIF